MKHVLILAFFSREGAFSPPISVPQPSAILVSHIPGKVAWIRVSGKGDLSNSPRVSSFAKHMIAKGEKRIVVDLEDCTVMDSTFMGTLTGISRKLQAAGGPKLEVINANERNQDLIEGLGLDFIFTLDTDGEVWGEEREAISKHFKEAAAI